MASTRRSRRNRTALCYTEEVSSDDDMSQCEASPVEEGSSDDGEGSSDDDVIEYEESPVEKQRAKKKRHPAALVEDDTTSSDIDVEIESDDGSRGDFSCSALKWMGTSFASKRPRVLSMEERMEAFDKKFHLQEAVSNANAPPELKEKYEKAGRLLRKHLEEYEPCWLPKNLTRNRPGVYVVVYKHGKIKIGMSFQCITRVKDQGVVVFAFLAMDLEEIKEIVSDKDVDAIAQLDLPGLACHKDKQVKTEDLIRLQIYECLLACSFECVTGTVCERFLQVPSKEAQKIVTIDTAPFSRLSNHKQEALCNVPDGGNLYITTWETLRSHLYAAAPDSSFLQSKLRPLPDPKEGAFVKENRLSRLAPAKYSGYKDCVSVSPRVCQVQAVVNTLRPLLEDDVQQDFEAIQACFAPIQGSN
ncbi:expressed unknown protein [Seminavis robusta]|uniref:Uncharacterized protein n=1 Tax=Seminavis robusta TaxID=568900 RepID=A0A9N8H870_9STRA|nr:expressed unknown protein [Seminavis robusta]|eukprot:Sro206_g086650.1 n/a (416) ;mRNA; r:63153-64400